MRNTFSVCLLLLFTYAVISCQENNEYLGDWELQSWSFDIEMDLNNDNTSSFNLLEETSKKLETATKETLKSITQYKEKNQRKTNN